LGRLSWLFHRTFDRTAAYVFNDIRAFRALLSTTFQVRGRVIHSDPLFSMTFPDRSFDFRIFLFAAAANSHLVA
jgi:hypothetical protein